jgi:hypothetical protein
MSYMEDVHGAADIDKVHRQKMMLGREVQALLRLYGAESVDVRDLQWFREGEDGEVSFLATNRHERDRVRALYRSENSR